MVADGVGVHRRPLVVLRTEHGRSVPNDYILCHRRHGGAKPRSTNRQNDHRATLRVHRVVPSVLDQTLKQRNVVRAAHVEVRKPQFIWWAVPLGPAHLILLLEGRL